MYTQLKPIFAHPVIEAPTRFFQKKKNHITYKLLLQWNKKVRGGASILRLTQRASLKNATDTNKMNQ